MAETIGERLAAVWARTERIFEILAPEAIFAQPIALRPPFIFYVGHLPAFTWNHICDGVLGRPSTTPAYRGLSSRGIDPDVDDPSHCHEHPEIPDRWPALAEVLAYRDRVRATVLESVDAVAECAPAHLMARNARVFSMVIEHELMHQETLLYMLQELAHERKIRPAWLPPAVMGRGRPPATVPVAAGTATLGAELQDVSFAWDNESPSVEVFVPAFSIDATPVTNGEFLAFVDDGGYGRRELGAPVDWGRSHEEKRRYPSAGMSQEGRWLSRCLSDPRPVERVKDWPAYVS